MQLEIERNKHPYYPNIISLQDIHFSFFSNISQYTFSLISTFIFIFIGRNKFQAKCESDRRDNIELRKLNRAEKCLRAIQAKVFYGLSLTIIHGHCIINVYERHVNLKKPNTLTLQMMYNFLARVTSDS